MNNTARFLSIAAVAAFASFGAQADEADASQFATKFETNRTRAEVQAEAATVAQTRSIEPAGSRVVTYKSTADRAAVRAQADEADASPVATKFETNRTRAEVAAEAATVAQTRSIEPAGSRVVTYKSTADRAAVRAQAAEALRTGQISSGELGNAM